MKTKFTFLAVLAAMTLGLVSCKKDNPSSNLVDQLCSMYGQSKTQAVEIANGMGYTSFTGDEEIVFCYRNATELEDQIGINLLLTGGVVETVSYSQNFSGTTIGAKTKEYSEQVGETRTVGSYSCRFSEGTIDSGEEIKSYSNYLQQVGSAQDEAKAIWNTGVAGDKNGVYIDTEEEEEGSVLVVITIGYYGDYLGD